MKPLFFLLFAPVLLADPLFNLMDCTGREVKCSALFGPREPFPDPSQYLVEGRVVVGGVDLGPAWSPEATEVSYLPLLQTDSSFLAWAAYSGEDLDGWLVKCTLEGLTYTIEDLGMNGDGPHIIRDINRHGEAIANRFAGNGNGAFINQGQIKLWMVGEEWWEKLPYWGDDTTLFRINDKGQILGSTLFNYNEVVTTNLFVLTPVGVDVHTPEPGTWLLFLGGALLVGGIKTKVHRTGLFKSGRGVGE